MQIIRQLDQLPAEARGGAVAIGNFDGVHRGHSTIITQLLKRAKEVAGPAVVFTFDPHPVRLLRPEQCPPPLTWLERKAELLAALGVDWVVAYPTDKQLLELTAKEFFDKIVLNSLAAKALVEGPNFYFGHGREGDVELLRTFATEANLSLDVVTAVAENDEMVSSSRIRKLLSEGHVAEARQLLNAPYRLRGMVIHGAGRGAELGFPTANLEAIDTLLPSVGVYAGVGIVENQTYPAAIHIGANPTFDDHTLKVEVHLVGRNEPLYGKLLEVDFLEKLRDTEPFESPEKLVVQLKKDVQQTVKIVNERKI